MEAIVENHTAGTNTFEYDTLHAGSGKPAADTREMERSVFS